MKSYHNISNHGKEKFRTILNKSILLKIIESKQKYYVSIKPHRQVPLIFCHKNIQEAYKQILSFLMSYFIGYIENCNINSENLKSIIDTLSIFFNIKIISDF
jgi:hypothetical protein